VEVGLKRAAARRGGATPDRFESEDIKFHQELRERLFAAPAGSVANLA
jgi:dTMP kinase